MSDFEQLKIQNMLKLEYCKVVGFFLSLQARYCSFEGERKDEHNLNMTLRTNTSPSPPRPQKKIF